MSTESAPIEDPVFRTIRDVISEVTRLEPEEISPENPVTGLRNVDSIVLLEIVVKAEVALGIEIDEMELFDIDTVADFVTVCRRLTALIH